MARPRVHCKPYGVAVGVFQWACSSWSVLDGICTLAGFDFLTLDADRALNVALIVLEQRAMVDQETRVARDRLYNQIETLGVKTDILEEEIEEDDDMAIARAQFPGLAVAPLAPGPRGSS